MLAGPPPGFDRADLVLIEVDPGELLRLAFRTKISQLTFRASARYRFDAPVGEFGVLYAAFDLATAFAETVLRTVPQSIPAGAEPLLTYEKLARRRVVHFAAAPTGRALRLVKLYDEGLAAAKVDNRSRPTTSTRRRGSGRGRSTIIRTQWLASLTCPGSWGPAGRWCCSTAAPVCSVAIRWCRS